MTDARWVADDAHQGTPEEQWAAGEFLVGLPSLDVPIATRLVVVAPHPDDAVFGAGGLIADTWARGVPVTVVAVTDGEGSHPHLPELTADDLRTRRAAEDKEALRRLTDADIPRWRIGLPDGSVAGSEQSLTDQLATLLAPGVVCLAPWDHDGHPDHDAAGRAAAIACSRKGATLMSYLVWTWHWSHPGDPVVPWASARRWELNGAGQKRKRWAADAFDTQIRPLSDDPDEQPPLPAAALVRWLRPFEVYLI